MVLEVPVQNWVDPLFDPLVWVQVGNDGGHGVEQTSHKPGSKREKKKPESHSPLQDHTFSDLRASH